MPVENPAYDVAISFLYEDLALAQALYEKLSEGLEVFFFLRNQEELVATDGLESMREPFRNESRLNIVLYRPRWGHTRWTSVEEAAIKDSCLDTGFKSLFFFVIEPTTELPKWLPETHVRFNYSDFTLDQAVGAIKARVQERGGHYKPLTPARRAELIKAEDDYRHDRSQLSSSQGISQIVENVKALFEQICGQCEEANCSGNLSIQCKITLKPGVVEQTCVLSEERVGMVVTWYQPSFNWIESAMLIVREFNRSLLLPPGYMHWDRPEMIKESKYVPDLSRARDYGWTLKQGNQPIISTKEMASKTVLQFLELIERDRCGRVRRK